MNFEEALVHLKAGKKIRRPGSTWDGYFLGIILIAGDGYDIGDKWEYRDIDTKALLAEDWEIAE